MGEQYDLFGGIPPHVRKSQTSKEAAISITESSGALRSRISIKICYAPKGKTCDEIEKDMDLRHQTASARIRELVLKNEIYDSGLKRKTRSGRNAVVYFHKNRLKELNDEHTRKD